MKIILIGPSCVGKTLIGRKLALKLKFQFIDQDEYLHSDLNFKKEINYSKEDFIEKKRLEFEIFEKVLSLDNSIIFSTGEGFIVNTDLNNLVKIKNILNSLDNVIYLFPFEDVNKSLEVLKDRWKVESITDLQKKLFFKYHKLFLEFSNKIIYTENKSFDEIIFMISKNLKKY